MVSFWMVSQFLNNLLGNNMFLDLIAILNANSIQLACDCLVGIGWPIELHRTPLLTLQNTFHHLMIGIGGLTKMEVSLK